MTTSCFGKSDVLSMFVEMTEWLEKQQVADKGHQHCNAIYFPTEDRYCNRDTACASAVFMRQFSRTGKEAWKKKAECARDYVLAIQREQGGYPELRGSEDSDDGSAVNTSIIADNLIRAYALGLEHGKRDLEALERMANFELTLEWIPGAFYHDTNHLHAFKNNWGDKGSRIDCQNTTALSAMMLQRIYYFLKKNNANVKFEWLDAAGRAIKHLLEGQDPNGHWPYITGCDWIDMNHHGMVMFHLEEAAEFAPYDQNSDIKQALMKGGKWLVEEGILQTKKGSKLDWAIQQSACIYFTWGYFVTSASLARLARFDPKNGEFWKYEALELLRYVRTDLWNNPEKNKEGPFRLIEGDIRKGYAWFGQSMGWCVYQLSDLITEMGWW
ncbi:MAG: hypothetical protein ABIH24_10115 [Verrucomicrobiota bacterium]